MGRLFVPPCLPSITRRLPFVNESLSRFWPLVSNFLVPETSVSLRETYGGEWILFNDLSSYLIGWHFVLIIVDLNFEFLNVLFYLITSRGTFYNYFVCLDGRSLMLDFFYVVLTCYHFNKDMSLSGTLLIVIVDFLLLWRNQNPTSQVSVPFYSLDPLKVVTGKYVTGPILRETVRLDL